MKQNVGSTDRLVRIAAGILLLGAFLLVESNLRWLGLIGIVPILTGASGWCPAYTLFGASTCNTARKAG